MTGLDRNQTPKTRPMPQKRTALVASLDIGTSKIACMIARLRPCPPNEALRGRTHAVELIGYSQIQSRGMKAGAVVDLAECEQAVRQGVIRRHVGHLRDQDEIRAGRHAVTLQDGCVGGDQGFELRQLFDCLMIQCDFNDGRQRGPDHLRRHQRDLPLYHPCVDQPFDTPQTGGRRRMYQIGQFNIRHRRIGLQGVEYAAVQLVQRNHKLIHDQPSFIKQENLSNIWNIISILHFSEQIFHKL